MLRILQRIVQKIGDHLTERPLVTMKGNVRLDRAGEHFAPGLCQSLERLHQLVRQVREGKVRHLQMALILLHFGQVDQIVCQRCQSLDLELNVPQPLVFSALHIQHIRIGGDDSQRRFDLMARIGDEPFLLFIALRHRLHDPSGQQEQQNKHRQQSQGSDQNTCPHKAVKGQQVFFAVHKDKQGFFSAVPPDKPEVSVKAFFLGPHCLCVLRRACFIHRRDFFRIGRSYGFRVGHGNGEIAAGKQHFRGLGQQFLHDL